MFFDVTCEGSLVGESSQSVRVRLCEEFHASGGIEFLEFLQYLRRMHLQLFDTCTGERESHLEIVSILSDHLLDGVEGRHIGTVGDVGDGALILIIIIVIVVGTDIEEAVTLEMDDLMYLKI